LFPDVKIGLLAKGGVPVSVDDRMAYPQQGFYGRYACRWVGWNVYRMGNSGCHLRFYQEVLKNRNFEVKIGEPSDK